MQPPKTLRGFAIQSPFSFWKGDFFMAPFPTDKGSTLASFIGSYLSSVDVFLSFRGGGMVKEAG